MLFCLVGNYELFLLSKQMISLESWLIIGILVRKAAQFTWKVICFFYLARRFKNSIWKKSVAFEVAYAGIQYGGPRIAYASALKQMVQAKISWPFLNVGRRTSLLFYFDLLRSWAESVVSPAEKKCVFLVCDVIKNRSLNLILTSMEPCVFHVFSVSN